MSLTHTARGFRVLLPRPCSHVVPATCRTYTTGHKQNRDSGREGSRSPRRRSFNTDNEPNDATTDFKSKPKRSSSQFPDAPDLRPRPAAKREAWQIQKAALSAKLGDQTWAPRKRVSPDALEGIRALHAQDPTTYTTRHLAEHFKISPEAVRRILKSAWRPSETETEDRRRRWEKRGAESWAQMVELGIRPPKKWRDMGVGKVVGEDGKVQPPMWKNRAAVKIGDQHGDRKLRGERWIQSTDSDMFARVADAMADANFDRAANRQKSHSIPDLSDRIL